MLKILCIGFKVYINRAIYKYEFILAIFTTLRLIPSLYQTELTYFQVLRIFRLIKSSPMLEDFVNKVKFIKIEIILKKILTSHLNLRKNFNFKQTEKDKLKFMIKLK